MLGGVALFVAANALTNLTWTPAAALYLALAIAGGALVEISLRILIGALSFRWHASEELMYVSDGLLTRYGNYPLGIYGAALSFLFTFLIPLAFVAYFPATVLLGRTAELQVHPAFAYIAPFAGIAWIMVAIKVFAHEMRRYQSAGN